MRLSPPAIPYNTQGGLSAEFIKKAKDLQPFYFIVVVWGNLYIDYLLNQCIASLLSPGNIPALHNREKNKFLIATTEQDWIAMQSRPVFLKLKEYLEPICVAIPPCPNNVSACVHMGIGHKLATQRAYDDRAYAILLTPDLMVSDGTMFVLQNKAIDGYDVVLVAALRFAEEPLFKHLEEIGITTRNISIDKEGAPVTATGRQLVWAGIQSFHSETLRYEWDSSYFSGFPVACWWRITEYQGDTIIIHSLSWAPLLVNYSSVMHHDTSMMNDWTIDGDYIYKNFGLNNKIYTVTDSDEIMLVSWTPLQVGALPLIPKDIYSNSLVRNIVQRIILNYTYFHEFFDPLKRKLFKKSVFWHTNGISKIAQKKSLSISRMLYIGTSRPLKTLRLSLLLNIDHGYGITHTKYMTFAHFEKTALYDIPKTLKHQSIIRKCLIQTQYLLLILMLQVIRIPNSILASIYIFIRYIHTFMYYAIKSVQHPLKAIEYLKKLIFSLKGNKQIAFNGLQEKSYSNHDFKDYYQNNKDDPSLHSLIFYSSGIQRTPNTVIKFRYYTNNGVIIYKSNTRINNVGCISNYDYNFEIANIKCFNILILGGEQTASSVSDCSWPDYLQNILNDNSLKPDVDTIYRVYNYAWPDAGPEHYLDTLESFSRILTPDLVIVNFVETDYLRGIKGAKLRYNGLPVKTGIKVDYSVRGKNCHTYVTQIPGYHTPPHLSSPCTISPRPYGLFCDNDLIDSPTEVRLLQRRIVFDVIKAAWKSIPFYKKLLPFSLPSAHSLRQFDQTLFATRFSTKRQVNMVGSAFQKILSINKNTIFLHNFNLHELKTEYKLSNIMKNTFSISYEDMRNYIAKDIEFQEITSWYMHPYMSEKWSLKGHKKYASLVFEAIKDRLHH